jgi:hypothetical protein
LRRTRPTAHTDVAARIIEVTVRGVVKQVEKAIKNKIVFALVVAAGMCALVFALVNTPYEGPVVDEKDAIVPMIISELHDAAPVERDEGAETGDPRSSGEPVREEKDPIEVARARETLGVLARNTQVRAEEKESELLEMEEMLALLEERGNDPERVEKYKALISDTKKELKDLKETLSRYEKELEKE